MFEGILYTDGGSRGNPGESGFGFVLSQNDDIVIMRGGWYLLRATNNVAEYSALVWGLQNARSAGISDIKIYADSELMVKQIRGEYKVKSVGLKPLYQRAKEVLGEFDSYEIHHVYRENNSEADALANEAMDNKGPVGDYQLDWEAPQQNLFADELDSWSPIGNEPGAEIQLLMDDDDLLESTEKVEKNQPYEGPGKLSGEDFLEKKGVYELTVKGHFDAAHALPGYPGACHFLHGHTWDVEVTISGTELDEVGILYDFKDIKNHIHDVLENFDHRCINDVAPFDRINPTAEHMSRILYYELNKALPRHIGIKEVAVWESPRARVSFKAK